MDGDEEGERVYLIAWLDEFGDAYLFSTSNVARADAKLDDVSGRYQDVRVNFRWREAQDLDR